MTVSESETELLLNESKRLRGQLADAVTELDRYVHALQDYLDRYAKENAGDRTVD